MGKEIRRGSAVSALWTRREDPPPLLQWLTTQPGSCTEQRRAHADGVGERGNSLSPSGDAVTHMAAVGTNLPPRSTITQPRSPAHTSFQDPRSKSRLQHRAEIHVCVCVCVLRGGGEDEAAGRNCLSTEKLEFRNSLCLFIPSVRMSHVANSSCPV